MITRVAAALVGLLVLLPALIFGGNVAVEVIIPIVAVICLDEYTRMAFPADNQVALGWSIGCFALPYVSILYLSEQWVHLAMPLVALATMVFAVMRPGATLEGASHNVGRYLIGVSWIGFLTFFPLLRRLEDGLVWIFLVITISWMSDTGAYFAGRTFGRYKLYERISPKKTWAGYFGGVLSASVGVLVLRSVAMPSLHVAECVLLGVVLGTAGVVGDLTESLFKRAYKVKDSGWIMPGHGGLMDRIDSVLFVGPLLYAYVVLWKGY